MLSPEMLKITVRIKDLLTFIYLTSFNSFTKLTAFWRAFLRGTSPLKMFLESLEGKCVCTVYVHVFVYYSICSPFSFFPSVKPMCFHLLPLDSFPLNGRTWAKVPAQPITDRFADLTNSNQKGLTHRAVSTKCYVHEGTLQSVIYNRRLPVPRILHKANR